MMIKHINLLLALTLSIHSLVFNAQNFQQIGDDINEESRTDRWGNAVSLNADGDIVAIGGNFNSGNGSRSGHVRVYRNLDGQWVQIGNDIDGESANDGSGFSLNLSGDGQTVAIGAPGARGDNPDDGRKGHVRVYRNINENWVQIGTDFDGYYEGDSYGSAVSLNFNGNIVAIKSPSHVSSPTASSYIQVFKYVSNQWVKVGFDIEGENGAPGLNNTLSLSANGSILATSEPFVNLPGAGNGNAGRVHVFGFTRYGWRLYGQPIHAEAGGDRFGASVSLSANATTLAVGAPFHDANGMNNAGKAYVFRFSNGIWVPIGSINGQAALDNFGYSVSLNGDGSVLAVGAPLNDNDNGSNAGSVSIYKNENGIWTLIGNAIIGRHKGGQSGRSISINSDGSSIAIGTHSNGINSAFPANARVFGLFNCQDNITLDRTITSGETIINEATNTIMSTSDITSGANVTYTAGNKNLLQSGFHVENGAIFKAQIGGCSPSSPSNLSKTETIKNDTVSIEEATQQDTMISLYPNPTSHKLIVSSTLNMASVALYNHVGAVVYRKKNDHPEHINILRLDLSTLNTGIYFLSATLSNGEVVVKKIVKQ